jgi:type VI secretion system protein VasD
MDAGSQLLIALSTDNEEESQGWKPDGLLYQNFLVMLRVYLGWRLKARITLTTSTRLLAVPPLGEGTFWLGMNGVLGAGEGRLQTISRRRLRRNWVTTPDFNLQYHYKETDVLRTSLIKPARWLPVLLAFSLTGCGVAQGVTEGARTVYTAVFYKKINVLHLDFTAREALNTDSRESHPQSEPVVLRVYQLKDRKAFDKTVYQQLLQDDSSILKDDLLASRDVVLKPGGDVGLDMPMEEGAKFVAVAGLFRHPDMDNYTWKRVLSREELEPDKPGFWKPEVTG